MASVSKCYMSLACDCWIWWAWEAPWDSASASAKVLAQLASASLINQHGRFQLCLPAWCGGPSASLMVQVQRASASLMVQAQGPSLFFMALVTPDSLRQRAIPNYEISFLLWVLMVDLVVNRHPRALLALLSKLGHL